KGALLRRVLRSALRFSDEAMARALRRRKTPFSRSSASLVFITRLDQYFPCRPRVFRAGLRRAAMPRNLRILDPWRQSPQPRASAALSFLPVARLTRLLIAFLPTISERFLRVPPQKKVNSPASPLAKCAPR